MANLNDLDFSTRMYDGWQHVEKVITFNGSVSGAIGETGGTGDPFNIFTVTGDVRTKIVGIVTTVLSGATATLELGVSGATASVLAQATVSGAFAESSIWHDATVDSGIELATVMVEDIIANGQDIIGTTGTGNIDSGVIRFNCLWRPLSVDGKVTVA